MSKRTHAGLMRSLDRALRVVELRAQRVAAAETFLAHCVALFRVGLASERAIRLVEQLEALDARTEAR